MAGLNREERMKMLMEAKRDPRARICPACKKRTRRVAKPSGNRLCNIECTYCGAIIEKDSKTAIPWTYV